MTKRLTASLIVFFAILILFFSSSHSTQAFRFVVMSDSHNTLGNVGAEQVATAIKKLKPEIILHAGDFVCCLPGQKNMPVNRFSFEEYKFFGGTPVFPTTGNHDYDGNSHKDYVAFWNDRKPNFAINGDWPYTYSFDYKGFHFIAIEWRGPDFTWVKNDLEGNAGKPTFIFSHLAALNTGCKPGYNRELSRIAHANRDIKAVFSGHSHCYTERVIMQGTFQIFVGTVSHDSRRDKRFRGKRIFTVVDVDGESLKICPASVEDGMLEEGCVRSP